MKSLVFRLVSAPGIMAPLFIFMVATFPTIIMAEDEIKIPMTLDISQEGERHVRASLSEGFPGGKNYEIQPSRSGKYFIGDVIDEHQVIIPLDPTAVTRYVLVQDRQNGMTYVRIITRWRNADRTFRSRIDEFIKRPADLYYMQIFRRPVEVDVLTQKSDQKVHVELSENREEHDREPGVTPRKMAIPPMLFTVQKHAMDEVMIGIVRYGHHILNDKVDGLMSRTIIWEGGLDDPIITITSKYTDGIWVENKYVFVPATMQFIMCNNRLGRLRVRS